MEEKGNIVALRRRFRVFLFLVFISVSGFFFAGKWPVRPSRAGDTQGGIFSCLILCFWRVTAAGRPPKIVCVHSVSNLTK